MLIINNSKRLDFEVDFDVQLQTLLRDRSKFERLHTLCCSCPAARVAHIHVQPAR
jgi:hypothetical protein